MTNALDTMIRGPLVLAHPVRTLGRSLWLYQRFLTAASSNGHVCRTVDRLAADLGVSVPDIETWLARLVAVKLVRVVTPPPYLVVKLALWPTSTQVESHFEPAVSGENDALHREVPVGSSSKLQAAAAAASSKSEDGGLGEGDEILDDAIHTIGAEHASEIRTLVAKYPPRIVQRALLRIVSMAPSKIRTSRLALFRYLLPTFNREAHDHPTHQT